MLLQCPEQFRLRKIKKTPESMGVDRFIGIVDHETNAINFRRKIKSGADLPAEKMSELYLGNWIETSTIEGEPDWTEDEHVRSFDLGTKMLHTYHEKVSPTVMPIAVEQQFREKLPGVPVPIVGYPDIEVKDRIIERKTSASKVSKPKSKWSFQGSIYSLVYDKPVEYQVVTKQVTPQVVTAAEAPALLVHATQRDATLRTIQQGAELLNDYWLRYGPDRPWPLNGLLHDWLCSWCFAGPKYGRSCIAWKK